MTESLQKSLSDSAIKLAARMLWDDDQFVRIGAIDTLVLAGEKALDIILNSMSGDDVPTIWALNDAVYALQKICPDAQAEEIKLFLRSASYTIAGLMVEELDLCVRTANCLEAADIITIRDLVTRSEPEMLKFRNFGRKSLDEVRTILGEMGLSFGMILDGDEPVKLPAHRAELLNI